MKKSSTKPYKPDGHTTRIPRLMNDKYYRYKIGDAFFHINLEQAQEMLEEATENLEEEANTLEEKLSTIREEMTKLKVELYARFGKQINLET